MQKHALQNPATPWLYREAPQKDFSSETNFKHFCTCPRSPSSPMMRSQVALFTDIFVTRREMSLIRSDSQTRYFVNPCHSNCLRTLTCKIQPDRAPSNPCPQLGGRSSVGRSHRTFPWDKVHQTSGSGSRRMVTVRVQVQDGSQPPAPAALTKVQCRPAPCCQQCSTGNMIY